MKTQTLIHTSFTRAFSETRTFSKTFAGVACALVFMLALCAACFTSLVGTPQAYADDTLGTTKTVTATQKITATFSADGTITVPDTQVQNGLDYTITIDDVSIESEYSFVSDWFFDGMEEEITIAPGKSMLMSWNAPSKVPASFEAEEEVHVGTIIYTYSYTVPALTGSIEIEGTPEVGQTLTAQVSDLPSTISESDLAYAWYVVADDGALTPIEGATSKTYEVAEQYAGKKLTCVATDTTGYYKGTLQAEPVTIKSPLTGSVSITQDGVVVEEAEAETELVATLSDEVPEDANPTYAWYVSEDGENFTLIESATDVSFTPDATYVDKYIKVEVASELYSGVLVSTNKVKITPVKIAFVVLSGDDTTGYDMYFCKRLQSEVPTAGTSFKVDDATTVTAAYVYSKLDDAALPEGSVSHDFENTTYGWPDDASSPTTPWAEKVTNINTATVVDTDIRPKSTSWWFGECESLTKVAGLNKLNTLALEDTSYMFEYCTELAEVDLTGWDMSSLVNMGGMFTYCYKLTTVTFPENMDTSNVKYMDRLFRECYMLSNLDLSNFDTSSAETFCQMFKHCWRIPASVTAQTKSFNTSNVKDMSAMFMDYGNMAEGTVLDISGWDTSNVTDMSEMFSGCSEISTINVSGINTSNVTDFCYMFSSCSGITSLDLSSFNIKNATSLYDVYPSSHIYRGGLSFMFSDCSKLTTLTFGEGWDTSNVKTFCNMFHYCRALTTIPGIENWNTSGALYMSEMFSSSANLVADCSQWDVSNVTDHYNFKWDANKVTQPSWS